jgi:signal transduction histidine kinase
VVLADQADRRVAGAPGAQLRVGVDEQQLYWGYIDGPLNQRLRQLETIYAFGEGDQAQRYSFAVSGRTAEIDVTLADFKNRLVAALALVGAGLLASTLLQVRFGLHPLRRIEQGLAAIRSGDATRLEGELPAEIESLQRELNALLKNNEDIIERARTQVGNLAHGLKTPLAVLLNEAETEASPLGAKVTEQVGVMRDQVQHYLDRARMAARAGLIGRVADVQVVAEGIVRALERIHKTKDLDFTVACEPGLRFQGERQDLEEMLGNLLDNAAKWSKGEVHFRAVTGVDDSGAKRLIITIDDDGPGLTTEQLAQPIQRGRRLDESTPGSGLGHSIVADLVHSYRGRFARAKADLGGLRVVLELPAA